MSMTPEFLHSATNKSADKIRKFLHEQGCPSGTCAYCKEKCQRNAFFCSDTFLAIHYEPEQRPEGMLKGPRITYISECFYEYFKDRDVLILEWITE